MLERTRRRDAARLAGIVAVGSLAACGVSQERITPEHAGQEARERMLRGQIEARGVEEPRVLHAMRSVPRERFVPESQRAWAYEDRPLPIGHGQTISQPFVVAAMTEALRAQPGDRVLEIGTGSGYQAAVLSLLVAQVYSIEIVPELAQQARETLAAQGHENVQVITGDGFRGLPDQAPFDGIIVTAAPEQVPPALIEQLAPGGRLVIPVGDWRQELRVLERGPSGVRETSLFPVRFVPMIGEAQQPRSP